jgi:type I restriction enzyme M protein
MSAEEQRAELHKSIWKIAEDLRGAVDGWDFKAYVLCMIFYRYISEDIARYIDEGEHEAGNTDFSYAQLSDDEAATAQNEIVREKGYFILPSQLFENVRELGHREIEKNADQLDLNIVLGKTFDAIEGSAIGTDSEDDMKGLFTDFDPNSNKLGSSVAECNEHLMNLMDGIGDMNLGTLGDTDIDTFGDAYEFLMAMYASSAGKSGGEYFTPQEVSRLLMLIALDGRTSVNKVYDPTCGSGGILLQAAKILGDKGVRKGYYGQEKNLTTYNLCRINMFLHGINFSKFDIEQGDTLIDPKHWDEEPFDLIAANPPMSKKWAGNSSATLVDDPRFNVAGALAPKKYSDLAFTLHSLAWLAPNGVCAMVEFPGIMYRGGTERTIRKYLVDNDYVDAVIQMPANLFYGTPIDTDILVMRKDKKTNDILFIDASKEYVKEGSSNRLSEDNIQRILKLYRSHMNVAHQAQLVNAKDVVANKYNLSPTSYIEPEDTRKKININELNAEIAEIVKREHSLRDAVDSIVAELETEHE